MEDEDTFTKLPIEDRCVHKSWKARVSGYEAAAILFRQIDDEKSPEWQKFVPLIKKFVVDSNAPAQEKGLDATLAFVENCSAAGKIVGDVLAGIVQKCLAAPKAKTKELGAQICLMYIEIDKQENVLEELLKGCENKNPKISAACLHVLCDALKDFGAKVINVNKILKRIIPFLEDRDMQVRTETKLLLAEIYKWLGSAVESQLSSLKPVQLAEVKAEFAKVVDTDRRPTRLLRSQQMKTAQVSGTVGTDGGTTEEDVGGGEEIDPYDLLEPVDVLSLLPKNFYTQLESKKWLERKEVLEVLDKALVAAPKLENADYGDLVRALKKIVVKDSNVVVVVVGIKCLNGLAKGLKKKFHQYAGVIIAVLFEKFKEKKQNVVIALREAVDSIYITTSLDQILEDVLANLDNKNPNTKAEMAGFLARCFTRCTPTILNKKLLKPLVAALLKAMSDQDPQVRDNAAQAIGTAMKVVGEKAISPYLTELDASKMTKVKECCEKAEILVKVAKVVAPAPPKSESQAKSKTVRPKSGSAAVVPPKSASDEVGLTMDHAEALNKVSSLVPSSIIEAIGSDDTKTKENGYSELLKFVQTVDTSENNGHILLALLAENHETNKDLVKQKLNIMKHIATTMPLSGNSVQWASPAVIRCMSIAECSDLGNGTLWALANNVSVDEVLRSTLSNEAIQGDPNLWVEALNWATSAVMKTGIVGDSSFLIECGKTALSQSNVVVRNAGLALIGTIHVHVGSDAQKVDNASLPKIQKSSSASKVVEPQRSASAKDVRSQCSTAPSGDGSDKYSSKETLTRVDIGSQLTEQLIEELNDKNWKVRAEAVVKVQNMINNASQITGNLGDAPVAIANRITDSNTKIAASAVTLVESIAIAMGPACKQHIRFFLPPLLKAIGDSKVWIRTAVVKCLNSYGEIGGYKEFFESEIIADALRSGTPTVRSELWLWLSEKLPIIPVKSIPKEELTACLPTLYANLEDRNADVRKNACESVLGFMIHLGYNTMSSACDNIVKGSSGTQVKQILDKTRGNLPEKPAPKAKLPQATMEKGSKLATAKLAPGSSATITKSKAKTGTMVVRPVSRKKDDDQDTSELLKVNNLKHQRVIDEQKLKTIKWNFVTPRAEFIYLLRDQMTAADFNKTLISNMFHVDFKYHLKAIDSLAEDLPANTKGLISNLDLILRWMTLRFFDTNPSVIARGLEYLVAAFKLLRDEDYYMLDSEAAAFLPYLILKSGDAKDIIQKLVRELFLQLRNIYAVSKLFVYLMEGVKSKNSRQRSVCLELLNSLIESYGFEVCHPSVAAVVKDVIKYLADRDTVVRSHAFKLIVTLYVQGGEKIISIINQVSHKDASAIEDKVRRAAKNRPVASVKPLAVEPISETIDDNYAHEEEYVPEEVEQTVTPVVPCSPVSSPMSRNETDNEEQPLDRQQIEENFSETETHPVQSFISAPIFPFRITNLETEISEEPFDVLPPLHSARNISSSGTISPSPNDDNLVRPANGYERSSSTQSNSTTGEFNSGLRHTETMDAGMNIGFDMNVLELLESESVPLSAPRVADVDIHFLKDANLQSIKPVQMPKMTPTLSNFTHPTAIKWELTQIASSDIEKAMASMTQIDTVLNSEKRGHLAQFVDYMVGQLVHQLIILNQSSHPEVVNCYRANFALQMKLCSYPDLCGEISEPSVYRVIEQLLLLLGERKLESLDKAELFSRVVNNIVLLLLDNANKTNIMCALITMLHDTVNNPMSGGHFQELVVKCVWKLNRTQAKWDSELDYHKVLETFHIFLKEHPSAWWKTQSYDVPLRTVKTVLHTMVKTRGTKVRQYIKDQSKIPLDSELYSYVNKVIKHLRIEDGESPLDYHRSKENVSHPSPRLSKEAHEELSEIFRMIGDTEETHEGLKRLQIFKKSFPDADIQPFLMKSTPIFQQYIRKGLANLEQQVLQETLRKTVIHESSELKQHAPSSGTQDGNKKPFTEEAEHLWKRLSLLQEKAGCNSDKKKEDK